MKLRTIIRLPKDFPNRFRNLEKNTQKSSVNIDNLKAEMDLLKKALRNGEELLHNKISSISSQVNEIREIKGELIKNSGLQADEHFFDDYYKEFENKFRGDEDTITQRLDESYGDFFKSLPKQLRKKPAIDIGSGRGELLSVLGGYGFNAVGVDLNGEMVNYCKNRGLQSVQDDAIHYLRSQKDGSLSGVAGIHIAEHLPFELLYTLLVECRRAVAKGGFVLFETPNPENVTVGAHTFWFDSSHIKPLPPLAFSFLAEYIGFSDVSIKRMRPIAGDATLQYVNIPKDKEEVINRSLFGPVDYALIARP